MGIINCKWDKILALGPLLFPFEWWSRNSRVFPTVKQDKDPSYFQRYFPFYQNMSNSKMLQKLQVWVYPNDPNQQGRMIQFLPPKWKGNNWFLKMIAGTWKVKTWGKLKRKLVWTHLPAPKNMSYKFYQFFKESDVTNVVLYFLVQMWNNGEQLFQPPF